MRTFQHAVMRLPALFLHTLPLTSAGHIIAFPPNRLHLCILQALIMEVFQWPQCHLFTSRCEREHFTWMRITTGFNSRVCSMMIFFSVIVVLYYNL